MEFHLLVFVDLCVSMPSKLSHLSAFSLSAERGLSSSLGAVAVSGALLNTAWPSSLLDITSGACSGRVRIEC